MRSFGTLGIITLALATFIGLNSIFIVSETQQALVVRFGDVMAVHNEVGDHDPGLHFKAPFIDNVYIYDKRNLEFNMRPAEILAADQERLIVDAFLRYRIVNPLRFYQTVTNELRGQQALAPIMQDSLRGVIASIESHEVISGQRATLMVRVRQAVEAQVAAQDLGIEVVDVRILRADLPPQIAEQVFQRMISERRQMAAGIRASGEERARQIRAQADREAQVLRAEAEADSERLRGDGDAQRTAIFADAYGRDPEFYAFYRSMQAYETAIAVGTPIVVPPDSEFFEYFSGRGGN
jgi:membrane protease subunit HflC